MVKSLIVGVVAGTLVGILLRQRGWIVSGSRTVQPRVVPPRVPPVVTEAAAPSGGAEGDELEGLTRPELHRRAAAAGIRGRSQMTKAQLIAALRATGAGGL